MIKAPEVRLAGIPVRFEPVFFLVILLLGLGQEPRFLASWILIATVSILVHELGHAVAFRAYGLQPRVVLHGMGGLTTGEGALGPGARIVTSLAGPLAALVLLGVPAAVLAASDSLPAGDATTVVEQVVWINVGWSVLNLVPVLPLDGGQVFLAVCDLVTQGRGRRVAEIVSVAVAVALAVWAYSRGFVIGALLAGGLGALNLGQLRKVRQEELLDELAVAHRALLAGDLATAEEVLARVRSARPGAATRAWCRELEGWCDLLAGRPVASAGPGLAGGAGGAATAQVRERPSASLGAAATLLAGHLDQGAAQAAWALAHDEPALPKSLLAVVVARTGTAATVASELVLLDQPGLEGATLLRDLLVHLGHHSAAAAVTEVVA